MGIKGLSRFLSEHAPGAAKDVVLKNYFGRKIAVDASMHIYQFMMVVGRQGDQMLTNEAGDVTSHLQGMFYRTIRMLEAGVKPLYVFDGEPPALKKAELAKRGAKRGDAEEALTAAQEAGKVEDIEKYSKRSVRVTKVHNEECMRLLTLMGVPILQAPGEAEAQCASLTRDGLAYSVATEDMDALPTGAVKLSRNLMAPISADKPVTEYDLSKVLEGLELTMDQFIDFCILCGCDYCDTIRNIGPVTAYKLIKTHKSIEGVIAAIDPAKYPIPQDWPFAEARKLFQNPPADSYAGKEDPFKWGLPDEEGLVQFLVNEKQFQEERVRSGCKKMRDAKSKGNQGRIESFFKVMAPDPEKAAEQAKRKAPEPPAKGKGPAAKKGPAAGKGGAGSSKGGKGKAK